MKLTSRISYPMIKKISAIGGLIILLIAVPPLAAFAQGLPPGAGTAPLMVTPPKTAGPISTATGVVGFVNNILGWLATIFWILAILFIFYAAYLYLTAAGDETKVETATHVLKYAIIAIVVGLMAYGLPLLINNVLINA